MKLTVRVKPNARIDSIERLEDGSYKILVRAIAEKGTANQAVIKILADHFHVPRSAVEILAGQVARTKIVQVHQ